MRLVVAIDGPAGSGKSTLARALARALELPYVNTGLMYRALARAALDAGVAEDDEPGLVGLIPGLRFRVGGADPAELEVEGYGASDLATPAVDGAVSAVSRHPGVRRLMRARQRELGEGGAVVEGRDIGTVVFPDADLKLFLRADPAAREARRALERDAPTEEVARSLRERDERDRRVNPLEPAPDAVVIDTTSSSREETLARALAEVERRR